jgi:hypothetical protein
MVCKSTAALSLLKYLPETEPHRHLMSSLGISHSELVLYIFVCPITFLDICKTWSLICQYRALGLPCTRLEVPERFATKEV